MSEIMKKENEVAETYVAVRNSIINAQQRVHVAINNAMVYRHIGKLENRFIKPVAKMIEQNTEKICCSIFQNIFLVNLEKDFQYRI